MLSVPFISNKLQDVKTGIYCAILGENPSKGARSPLLWNRCFREMDISCYFYPFDIDSNNLNGLIDYLKSDDKFLGGAVAVPHKESLIDLLDEVEDEAKLIGAVNLIYKTQTGLCGANTDGFGAVASLAEKLDSSIDTFAQDKTAILIGTGGAAKAVAVYMAKSLGKKGEIFIVGRDVEKITSLVKKCSNFTSAKGGSLDEVDSVLPLTDFLINCTAIGYENNYVKDEENFYLEPFLPVGATPTEGFIYDKTEDRDSWLISNSKILELNYNQSKELFNLLNKSALVMDVVYQPEETMFLKMAKWYGYSTLSGKRMNLLQAAYGYYKSIPNKTDSIELITSIMEKV